VSALQLEYSLVERGIEDEFVPLGLHTGMGVMVWSPLAMGLLSGKYRKADAAGGGSGEGRLAAVGTANPIFNKFSERNWRILGVLEEVADAIGRPMAQVALNWVANRPGVATVIVGATKLQQLDSNLRALDFELPPELAARLDEASRPEPRFPYTFFQAPQQAMITGGASVGDKRPGYAAPIMLDAPPSSVSSE